MACLNCSVFSSNPSAISHLLSHLPSLSNLELHATARNGFYRNCVRSKSVFNFGNSSSVNPKSCFFQPRLNSVLNRASRHRYFTPRYSRSITTASMSTSTFGRPSAEPIVFPAKGTHTATIIWLHGLGDTGNGWSDIGTMMNLPNIKWILPTAPIRPVSVNGGFPCTAWFDIIGLTPGSPQDLDGLDSAAEFVANIIEKEIESSGPSVKFAVGGFSMGGALALHFLSKKLTGVFKNGKPFPDVPLNGVVCLSGWLPNSNELISRLGSNSAEKKVGIPIICCHGTDDMVVPYKFGELSAQALEKAGLNSKFKKYSRMGHEASQEELSDVKAWVKENFC